MLERHLNRLQHARALHMPQAEAVGHHIQHFAFGGEWRRGFSRLLLTGNRRRGHVDFALGLHLGKAAQ